MAMNLGTIRFLADKVLPRVAQRGRMISLSRQLITTPPGAVKQYLAENGFRTDIPGCDWDRRLTSRELFLAFGFERYDDIDFTADEGCTVIHDMNRPIPKCHWGQYDLVLEMGTMEHIFDTRAVFENMIRMTKVGGTVFHFSPLTWINHGFYNYSLTVFYDVYRSNGFRDIEYYFIGFPKNWTADQRITHHKTDFLPEQFTVNAPDVFVSVACTAVKQQELAEFRVPIQAAYDPSLRLGTTLWSWNQDKAATEACTAPTA